MIDFGRYMSQVMIEDIGAEGQKKIQDARVLVVGAGGLGCPALLYLCGLGVGTIGIIDDDVVSKSNLHRQILFGENHIGKLKVEVARQKLLEMNSSLVIHAYAEKLTAENAEHVFSRYDIVVDCTDNIDTRYVIDVAGRKVGKPFVYGGVRKFEGQVAVYNYEGSGSFTDRFPDKKLFEAELDCASAGIVGFTAGVIGCLQVNEVLKIILGAGEVLADQTLTIDLQTKVMRKWRY